MQAYSATLHHSFCFHLLQTMLFVHLLAMRALLLEFSLLASFGSINSLQLLWRRIGKRSKQVVKDKYFLKESEQTKL
jgi:hypothetical protein